MRKKLFFFKIFLIFFLTIPIFTCFINFSYAQDTTDTGLIRYNWLDVQVTDSSTDRMQFAKGGYSLNEFQNLGIYQQTEDSVIFKSRVGFSAVVMSYIDASITGAYKDIDLSHQQKDRFLYHEKWSWLQFLGRDVYDATVYSIKLSDLTNRYHYSKQVPISVSIKPDFEGFGGQTLNGIEIKETQYAWEIKEVKVKDIISGECGSYQDEYTNQEVKEKQVSYKKMFDDTPDNKEAYDAVLEHDLGVFPGEYRKVTIQNEIIDTTPAGTTYTNSGPGAYIFSDLYTMRPRIEITKQQYEIRRAGIRTDYFWQLFQVLENPNTLQRSRIASVHLYNAFIRKTYEFEVNFLATVKMDAQEKETFLDNPYLRMGNWVWDAEFEGTDEVVLIDQNKSWWEQLWDNFFAHLFGGILSWVLPLLIVLGIGVLIFFYVKKKVIKN